MRCLLDESTVSSTSKGIMDSTPVEGWWWQRWWVSSRFGGTTSSRSQTMVNCWPILVVKFFFDTSSSDIIPFEMKVLERSGRLALPPTSTYCINQPVSSVICFDFPTIFPDLESCLVTVDPICQGSQRKGDNPNDIIRYYHLLSNLCGRRFPRGKHCGWFLLLMIRYTYYYWIQIGISLSSLFFTLRELVWWSNWAFGAQSM